MRILLVEDNEKLALSLKKGLEQDSYAVDAVFDGDDGYSYATTEDYDLIILDRMMPGAYDGMGILEQVRQQGISTPVLFLTAKDSTQDKVEGLNHGADDYLVKPFEFEELSARVKALLRRPANTLSTILTYKDLALDTIAYNATREGNNIDLTSTEYALLEYLMRHPGKVLSKQHLIEHVWDFDADILPNTVEAYIGYLRNKIDRGYKEKYLLTRRGFGYVFGKANG